MQRTLLLLACVICFGVGTTPCRADWGDPQPLGMPQAAPLPQGVPYTPPPPVESFAPPGSCDCGSCAPCCPGTCCRPGLIARIRDHLHGCNPPGGCCSPAPCCPRPGLIGRIRARRAERHCGCCSPY